MNDNLPAGAELDPSAPYNEPETIDLEVTIVVELTKKVTIKVSEGYSNEEVTEEAIRSTDIRNEFDDSFEITDISVSD